MIVEPSAEPKDAEYVAARAGYEAVVSVGAYVLQKRMPPWEWLSPGDQRHYVSRARDARKQVTPREEHGFYCRARRSVGWRHGEVYDPVGMVDPSLVSYEELPHADRLANELFHNVACATFAALSIAP